MENERQKMEEEEEKKKKRKTKKSKMDDTSVTDFNKKSGRVKKEYEHPVRVIIIKIKLKNDLQKDKLQKRFGTCRFIYN